MNAVIKAYSEINFNGCIRQSAKFRACSIEWCQGDETSGDIVTRRDGVTSKDEDSASADECGSRCKEDAQAFRDCQTRILNKWFRKFGVKEDSH